MEDIPSLYLIGGCMRVSGGVESFATTPQRHIATKPEMYYVTKYVTAKG